MVWTTMQYGFSLVVASYATYFSQGRGHYPMTVYEVLTINTHSIDAQITSMALFMIALVVKALTSRAHSTFGRLMHQYISFGILPLFIVSASIILALVANGIN
jgi:hypothetical protein